MGRRDNLTAKIHMVVEALFWFHPLVWWISARLMEERERACDEAVLELGGEPQVYAESILKICQLCVESPLACVPGIAGADLKRRLTRMLTQRSQNKPGSYRKMLLAAVSTAAIAGPIFCGVVFPQNRAPSVQTATEPLPSFEVASIRPTGPGEIEPTGRDADGRFTRTNVTAMWLIGYAYFNVQSDVALQVLGDHTGWIPRDMMLKRRWKTRSPSNSINFRGPNIGSSMD